MSDTPSPVSAKANCSWCGKPVSPAAHFCPECHAPNRPNGYVLFSLNFIARNLAIPMAIGLLTFFLTARHEDTERAISEHGKLIDAYGAFAQAHSEYRVAENTIAYMALNHGGKVDFTALTAAILQLDKAFDSIGAKLTPFEEYEKASPHYKSQFASGRTALEETWQDCFTTPYFTTDPKAPPGYQTELATKLQGCSEGNCTLQVAWAVRHVLDEIDSGRCTSSLPPGTVRTFDWFWTELARVMAGRPVAQPKQ